MGVLILKIILLAVSGSLFFTSLSSRWHEVGFYSIIFGCSVLLAFT